MECVTVPRVVYLSLSCSPLSTQNLRYSHLKEAFFFLSDSNTVPPGTGPGSNISMLITNRLC